MHTKKHTGSSRRRAVRATVAGAVSLLVALAQLTQTAHAGVAEQAKRIHDRIAGVPPSATVLSQMIADLNAGNPDAAAVLATQNPNFYNVTLKNFVAPWTNRDQTVFTPLNL